MTNTTVPQHGSLPDDASTPQRTSGIAGSRLDPYLAEFRNRHRVPALGAAIVTAAGELDVAVVGTTARGGSEPATIDDRWHLGSCCKSITALLYARLVDAGAARWEASLPELFPDLVDGIDPRWADATIEDVFAHQSGLAANPGRRELRAAYADTRPLRDQRTDAVAAALARPPRRRRFLYSNLGYILAGAAIERITDGTFEFALAMHVLEPLGVTSAGYGPPPRVLGHDGRPQPLRRFGVVLGRGAPADPRSPQSDNPPVFGPAGTLHLTLEDWARIQRVFITEGGGLVRPETVERLLTRSSGPGRGWALGWAPAVDLDECSWGMQGSNTFWAATALIDRDRTRTAMVVSNDGRTWMLRRTGTLAARLLAAA